MAKRAPSVAAILARRKQDEDILRGAIADIDGQMEILRARRAELERALGPDGPVVAGPVRAAPAEPQRMRCSDCGASVTAVHNEGECPACGAEPFEGEPLQ